MKCYECGKEWIPQEFNNHAAGHVDQYGETWMQCPSGHRGALVSVPVYLVETICGGNDAAGGGCGGPLGVHSTTKERWNDIRSDVYSEPIEHRSDEHDYADRQMLVKVKYRPCSGCYRNC